MTSTAPQPTDLWCQLSKSWQMHADEPAVAWPEGTLTYAELESAVDRVAHAISSSIVDPQSPVGLFANGGVDYVLALLACLSSNRTFVPIVPTLNKRRIEQIISQSEMSCVFSAKKGVALEQSIQLPLLPHSIQPSASEEALTPRSDVSAWQDRACIFATSGSSGRPKLVTESCALLAHFLAWERDELNVSLDDRIALLTPIAFDVSLRDILLPLVSGATLVIPDTSVNGNPAHLLRWLRDEKITIAHLVPTVGRELLRTQQRQSSDELALPDLRATLFAGEALYAEDVYQWRNYISSGEIYNLYGPSETTLAKLFYRVPADLTFEGKDIIALGKPLPGIKTMFSEEAPDELVLILHTPAGGYCNDSDLNAALFSNDFLSYRTRDLVRVDNDGNHHFLGRADFEIKVRGQRVNLLEIEASASQLDELDQACVVTVDAAPDVQICLAYQARQPIAADTIMAQLREDLPSYMLPNRVQWLEEFPKTTSGKINRPEIKSHFGVLGERPNLTTQYQQASSVEEHTLLSLWEQYIPVRPIGVNDNFFDVGGTSLAAIQVCAELGSVLSQEVPIARFYQHPTIAAQASAFYATDKATETHATKRSIDRSEVHDIAVVGMACRVPGADDVGTFWENLVDGLDTITRFENDELDVSVAEEIAAMPNYIRARGILEGAEEFDAEFFGMNKREAEVLDPQQRLFLEVAWHALEDAGYTGIRKAKHTIGVYGGVGDNSYRSKNIASHPKVEAIVGDHQIRLANEKDYVATRVAYKLGLTGPAISVHTACSTSLVATISAVQALRSGQCSVAVAGGAALTTPQYSGYLATDGAFNSDDGVCRPFSADANGTVFSNGAGAVILKPLRDAEEDGDQIYAVISGTAANNDGNDKVSFMAPSVNGQVSVIQSALIDADVEAADIDYVETHGTGTPVGDPIEFTALTEAFDSMAQQPYSCALGSVKGNIGHLDAAAGVIGLIKGALILHNQIVPKSLYVETPNPQLQIEDAQFSLQSETEQKSLSYVGVSSFGVGGTNAHVILKAGSQKIEQSNEPEMPVPIVVTGRTQAALQANAAALARLPEDASVADIAFTLNQGREHFGHQQLFLASNKDHLKSLLGNFGIGRQASFTPYSGATSPVFLFPGQGAQYTGMGHSLYQENGEFRGTIDAATDLTSDLDVPLRDVMFDSGHSELLNQTQYTQPAMFAIEVALAQALLARGIQPEYLIGHSIGEFAAAHISGILTFEAACTLVATRGRLMQQMTPGSMLVVGHTLDDLQNLPEEIHVAACNAPNLNVVAGPTPAVLALQAEYEEQGVFNRMVATSHAFHTPMLRGIEADFREILSTVTFSEAKIPIISTLYPDNIDRNSVCRSADYWVEHALKPVQFAGAVAKSAELTRKLFVEVGPGRGLTTLCRGSLEAQGEYVSLPAMSLGGEQSSDLDHLDLLSATIELYNRSSDDAERTSPGRIVSLPSYQFQKKRYWLDAKALSARFDHEEDSAPEATTLTGRIVDLICDVTGADADDLDHDASLTELGLDSLLLTQLGLTFNHEFGQNLGLKDFMESHDSINKLTTLLEADGMLSNETTHNSNDEFEDALINATENGLQVGLTADAHVGWFAKVNNKWQQVGDAHELYPIPGPDADQVPVAYDPTSDGRLLGVLTAPGPVREIWLADALAEDNVQYLFNESLRLSFDSQLDTERLKEALRILTARHQMLRATFDKSGQYLLIWQDLDELPFTQRTVTQDELAEAIVAAHEVEFDLLRTPLWHVTLLELDDGRYEFVFTGHHAVLDGWSKGQACEDLTAIYNALADECHIDTIPAPVDYSYFVSAMEHHRRSPGLEETIQYWENAYPDGIKAVQLPVDHARPRSKTTQMNQLWHELPEDVWQPLAEMAKTNGATPFMLLAAVFSFWLHRLTGQKNATFGVPMAGQAMTGLTNLIGHAAHFLPVSINVDETANFDGLLASSRLRLIDIFEHQKVSLGDLIHLVETDSANRLAPLSIMFNVDTAPHQFQFQGVECSYRSVAKSELNTELSVNCIASQESLTIEWGYLTDILDEDTIQRWMKSFGLTLESLAKNPLKPLAETTTISQADLESIKGWNNTRTELPAESFIELVQNTAGERSDATAVIAGDERLSYQELWTRVQSLAQHLLTLEVGNGHVGVCMERGVDMLVSVLAILRAGLTYVPLDPEFPVGRLTYMVENSGMQVLLGQPGLLEELEVAHRVELGTESLQSGGELPSIEPSQKAYILYTSGSTGNPKGVAIPHLAATNFLLSMAKRPGLTAEDRLLATTTLSFDISVLELFLPLLVGATVVIATKQDVLEGRVPQLLDDHEITVMQATPASWRLLFDQGWQGDSSLRVLCGGEALPSDLANKLCECVAELWNMYGPTETTVWSTCQKITDSSAIDIGTPIDNTTCLVVDDAGNICPIGVPGELYIGGDGVALEYWQLPEMTAERFVQYPYDGVEQRFYRTGDVVRWCKSGRLEYYNRVDNQVKIRGFRIELGDVETALQAIDGVKQAVAIVKSDSTGVASLVAFLVVEGKMQQSQIRKQLRANLPDYMIPSRFKVVDAIPLTPNEKVDRKTLANMAGEDMTVQRTPLKTDAQLALGRVWAQYLDINADSLEAEALFFEIGGHSLLAANMLTELREKHSVDIPFRELLVQPLSQLAEMYPLMGEITVNGQQKRSWLQRLFNRS